MEKSWLIRTTKHQILGPVSKQKVLDLIQKGMIADGDELASGNGFWFYFREREMVKQYILGDVEQPFDPISDVASVLHADQRAKTEKGLELDSDAEKDGTVCIPRNQVLAETDDANLPSRDDLEYPDETIVRKVVVKDAPVFNDDDDSYEDIEYQNASEDTDQNSESAGEKTSPSLILKISDDDEKADGILPVDQDLEYPSIEVEAKSVQTVSPIVHVQTSAADEDQSEDANDDP